MVDLAVPVEITAVQPLSKNLVHEAAAKLAPSQLHIGVQNKHADTLHLSVPVTLSGVPDLMDRLYAKHLDNSYQKTFPWVDQIAQVRVWNLTSIPRLDRIEISSGKRMPVGTISPPDSTGVVNYGGWRASKDGRTHVFSAFRLLTELFVANGLR
jgi:uncharacterized protein (TIGR04141 family)